MENYSICTYLDLSDCNKSSSAINNALDMSKSYQQDSPCYLTTMLCSILNLKDDNIYLKTIRNFRKNILEKDEKYKSLLVEYDIIGPKIAESLKNDPLRKTIADRFFNKYIVDIFYYIINNEIDKTVTLYTEMTNSLKFFYNLNNYSVTIDEINNADILKSGHGIYKKKITNQ